MSGVRQVGTDDVAVHLMSRLAAGDGAALGELYDLFSARCYTLAARLLANAELAEDAVQEAFLAAWRAPARYRPDRGSVATYLLTLTHRRAVDLLRRDIRQRRHALSDDLLDDRPDEGAPIADQVEARDRARQVRQALSALPEPQREALVLAYFSGYTQTEIAALTAVPLGTVKTRMFTAVRALRASLQLLEVQQ